MRIHWFFKFLALIAVIFVSWSLFYFVLPLILPVQNIHNGQVYGLIFSNQVWSGEVEIVGDIYTLTNSTVTILPGTKVKVAIANDKSNFDLLPWHRKSGVNTGPAERGVYTGEPFWDESEKIQIHLNNLIVNGNFSTPVTFKSDSIDPSPYDYNLIKVKSGFIHQGIFSDYRKFEIGNKVTIADSTFKDTGECGLCVKRNNPAIINNSFEENYRQSILIERGSPEINNNLFQNLAGSGIVIDARRLSIPVITNNNFEMPGQVALEFVSGGQLGEAVVARNIFAGNTLIRIACDSKVKIRDNVILGLIGFSSGCDGGFVFGPNYWGTPDPATIFKEKILNKFDAYQITIPSVLMIAPKEAGRK